VKFLGQSVDRSGQLGIRLELQFVLDEVVIRLGLLKGRLPILPDHHEGGVSFQRSAVNRRPRRAQRFPQGVPVSTTHAARRTNLP
jgi:hypothetical protein